MTRWGSMWLASQVEGEREPPMSQNDLLGVVGAGVAGGKSPGELLAVLLLVISQLQNKMIIKLTLPIVVDDNGLGVVAENFIMV